MAEFAYPQALTGMQDTQWSHYMLNLIEDGVTSDGAFAPTANGSGMTVTLAPGDAVIQGILAGDAAAASVTIPAAPAATSGLSRIDTIVKRLDRSGTPVIKTVVISGTATAGTPAPKSLTQDPTGVWEWPICDVLLAAGTVSINQPILTDRRTATGANVRTWTTRPDAPRNGTLGLNRSTGEWEWYDGSAWKSLVPAVAWADITGKPATFPPIIGSASNQAVAGNDARLTDSRTPTPHDINGTAHSGILGITKGGTGASTPTGARNALGVLVQSTPMAAGTPVNTIRLW